MNQLPLVSLCIPIFNGAEFIQPMLSSVRQNTYPNLEIIISDDGSQDKSLDFIYAAQLHKAQIFSHSRYGLVSNWNYCLTKATGKYIKFLFQDDTLESNCITKMVEIAEQDPEIGMVFCQRKLIYENLPDPKLCLDNLHEGWHNLQVVQSGLTLLQDPNMLKPPFNKIGEPTNVLIRKEVFERIGLFDLSLKQLPDLEMWFRIMAYYKVAFINEKLASFRIHANQTTHLNNAHDQTWSEIYQVWLKIINDPIYKVILPSNRQEIKLKFIKILLREYVKSIILRKLHRCRELNGLLKQALVYA